VVKKRALHLGVGSERFFVAMLCLDEDASWQSAEAIDCAEVDPKTYLQKAMVKSANSADPAWIGRETPSLFFGSADSKGVGDARSVNADSEGVIEEGLRLISVKTRRVSGSADSAAVSAEEVGSVRDT
jgi:hypothetical protein